MLAATLVRQGVVPPAPSTITAIPRCNQVAMRRGQPHPLTIIDNRSRYSVGLQVADRQRHENPCALKTTWILVVSLPCDRPRQ